MYVLVFYNLTEKSTTKLIHIDLHHLHFSSSFQPKRLPSQTNSFGQKISRSDPIWPQLSSRLPSHVGSHDLFHRAFHLCCDRTDVWTFHFQYKIRHWRKRRPMLCFTKSTGWFFSKSSCESRKRKWFPNYFQDTL